MTDYSSHVVTSELDDDQVLHSFWQWLRIEIKADHVIAKVISLNLRWLRDNRAKDTNIWSQVYYMLF